MPSDLPNFSVGAIHFIFCMAIRECCGGFVSQTVTVLHKFKSVWVIGPLEHSLSDVIFVCYLHNVHKRSTCKVDCDCVLLRV